MKNLTILLMYLFTIGKIYGEPDTVLVSYSDLGIAMNDAKKQDKAILLYYTAEWCAPCRVMESTVFKDEEALKYINSKFVFVKVDIDTEYGKELSKEFPVRDIPAYNTINLNRELLFAFEGSMETGKFIERLEESLDDTESALNESIRKYKDGSRSFRFLCNHLQMLEDYNVADRQQVYTDLFKNGSEQERRSECMFHAMEKYLLDYNSIEYDFVLENREKLEEQFGLDRVKSLLKRPYFIEIENAAIEGDEAAVDRLRESILTKDLGNLDNDLYYVEKTLLLSQDRFDEFIKLVEITERYPTAFGSLDERLLDGVSSVVLLDIKDKDNGYEVTKRAKYWLSKMEGESVQKLVMSGQIEEALENPKEALALYKKAVALHNKENPDVEATGVLSLIQEIEAVLNGK